MVGSQEHQRQIQHLEFEPALMQRGFQEMAARYPLSKWPSNNWRRRTFSTSQLFEHCLDNLQISRNVFLTQAEGLVPSDSSEQETIMKRNALRGPPSAPYLPSTQKRKHSRLRSRPKSWSGMKAAAAAAHRPTEDLSVLLYGSQTHLQARPVGATSGHSRIQHFSWRRNIIDL
ncbi:unnamed protein product [Coregonus sp. 'balchen']|nr:unnamed protein product [Coregonus sp. 'balchen']